MVRLCNYMILMAFLVGFIATIPLNLERNVVLGSNLETACALSLSEKCNERCLQGFSFQGLYVGLNFGILNVPCLSV